MTTVENMVKEHKKKRGSVQGDPSNKKLCNWDREEGVDHALFETIHSLLRKISTCERAVACSTMVSKELPMGKVCRYNIKYNIAHFPSDYLPSFFLVLNQFIKNE